jgi:hypothetical protein
MKDGNWQTKATLNVAYENKMKLIDIFDISHIGQLVKQEMILALTRFAIEATDRLQHQQRPIRHHEYQQHMVSKRIRSSIFEGHRMERDVRLTSRHRHGHHFHNSLWPNEATAGTTQMYCREIHCDKTMAPTPAVRFTNSKYCLHMRKPENY